MNSLHITLAASYLHAGGVIAYPTEAVWGLGCDPDNEAAVMSLLQIKQRPVEKGMILIGASQQQFDCLLQPLTEQQRSTLNQSWPGPYTWLVPDLLDQVPEWIKGKHSSVAIRVSAHPLVKALCEAFGGPIVSTSANIAGKPPAKNRLQVMKAFGSSLDYVLPGRLGEQQQPSRITDLLSGRSVR